MLKESIATSPPFSSSSSSAAATVTSTSTASTAATTATTSFATNTSRTPKCVLVVKRHARCVRASAFVDGGCNDTKMHGFSCIVSQREGMPLAVCIIPIAK